MLWNGRRARTICESGVRAQNKRRIVREGAFLCATTDIARSAERATQCFYSIIVVNNYMKVKASATWPIHCRGTK